MSPATLRVTNCENALLTYCDTDRPELCERSHENGSQRTREMVLANRLDNGNGRGATLEEVARVAGVSRATVSRVVNGNPRVNPDVRRAVERAVDRLGYVPNPAARSL